MKQKFLIKYYQITKDNNTLKSIEKGYEFFIKIVRGQQYNQKVEDSIIRQMREKVGSDITIKFEYTKIIEREKSGKLIFFKRID